MYRNGDSNFLGANVLVNKRYLRTWDNFLNMTTEKTGALFAVRKIATPVNGTKVKTFDQLQDHQSYVAISSGPFRKLGYTGLLEKHQEFLEKHEKKKLLNNIMNVKPVKHSRIRVASKIKNMPIHAKVIFALYRVDGTKTVSSFSELENGGEYVLVGTEFGGFQALAYGPQNKIIYVYENGKGDNAPHRVYLTFQILASWITVIKTILDNVKAFQGLPKGLYTADGRRSISNSSQLENCGEYVLVGNEGFQKADYGSYKTKKLPPIKLKPCYHERSLRPWEEIAGKEMQRSSLSHGGESNSGESIVKPKSKSKPKSKPKPKPESPEEANIYVEYQSLLDKVKSVTSQDQLQMDGPERAESTSRRDDLPSPTKEELWSADDKFAIGRLDGNRSTIQNSLVGQEQDQDRSNQNSDMTHNGNIFLEEVRLDDERIASQRASGAADTNDEMEMSDNGNNLTEYITASQMSEQVSAEHAAQVGDPDTSNVHELTGSGTRMSSHAASFPGRQSRASIIPTQDLEPLTSQSELEESDLQELQQDIHLGISPLTTDLEEDSDEVVVSTFGNKKLKSRGTQTDFSNYKQEQHLTSQSELEESDLQERLQDIYLGISPEHVAQVGDPDTSNVDELTGSGESHGSPAANFPGRQSRESIIPTQDLEPLMSQSELEESDLQELQQDIDLGISPLTTDLEKDSDEVVVSMFRNKRMNSRGTQTGVLNYKQEQHLTSQSELEESDLQELQQDIDLGISPLTTDLEQDSDEVVVSTFGKKLKSRGTQTSFLNYKQEQHLQSSPNEDVNDSSNACDRERNSSRNGFRMRRYKKVREDVGRNKKNRNDMVRGDTERNDCNNKESEVDLLEDEAFPEFESDLEDFSPSDEEYQMDLNRENWSYECPSDGSSGVEMEDWEVYSRVPQRSNSSSTYTKRLSPISELITSELSSNVGSEINRSVKRSHS